MSRVEVVHIETEADTEQLGQRLARELEPGTVISLVGTLGAGKTRLVQAIAAELGVPREDVTSPTFVLVNEYTQGSMPLYHFDAYRLKDDDEFLQLGPGEYFESDGITIVEWGDRVENCLPAGYLKIEIAVLEGERREITICYPP